jgi:hypothetical protein
MSLHRITVLAALGLVFAALAAPAALAQQDLRNPDTRDVAEALRLDLRNPDTRDMAEAGGASPEVTVVEVPVATPSPESGLDWGDAGIGAGGMLGLALLAAAGILAVTHRKGTSSRTATTG